MSTECESVVSPSIGPDLSRSLNLPSTSMRNNDRHSHSGISYKGRVSLIHPFNRYEAYRAGYNYDSNSANLLNSSSFPASPGHSRMPDSLYPAYMEHNFNSMMPFLPPQSHSTPESSKNNDTYNHQQEEKPMEIKQEKDLVYDPENIQMKDKLKNIDIEMNDLSHSSQDKNEEFPHHLDEKTKQIIDFRNSEKASRVSESLINPDVNVNYEDMSDSEYPEEKPSSPASDQNDQREMDPDASTLLNSYLDTTHEMIQHGENAKSLKCQYCPFSTDSLQEFKNHGIIHFDFRCMKCEYTTQTTEQLKDHLKDEHNLSSEEIIDLESVRIPKMNSQGKMKTFKCKQCGFVAYIKKEFWDHAKIHIKSDKLLACNMCPFVTEYKHHLEYHMRNHSGTKPFKCTKCSYSCVNKSMLNSHMKSHSNVYQYRCNSCSYATKYCHSLKLHLRKYNHTPAMVLNPDGTPNPVPIIDVYGTRRGPKLKKDENGMPILPPQYQLQAQFVRAQMEVTGTIPPAPTVSLDKYLNKTNGNSMNLSIPPPPPSFTNPFTFAGNIPSYPSFIPNEFMHSESPHKNDIPDNENESEDRGEKLNLSKSPEVQETFKCDICSFSAQAKDVLSHHMLLHLNKRDEINRDIPSTVCENEKVINNSSEETSIHFQKYANELRKHHGQQGFTSQFSNTQNMLQTFLTGSFNPLIYSHLMGNQGLVHQALDIRHHLQLLGAQQNAKELNNEKYFGNDATPVKPLGQSDTVLDLSKEHTPPGSVSSHQNSSSISPSPLPASPSNFDVATPPSKNRRKGPAFKLERIALRLSGSGEEENSCGESSDTHKEQAVKRLMENNIPQLLPLELPESKTESSSIDTNEKWNDFYECKFCDIAFKDDVMHNLHMGFHGFENPFTCNCCGFKANDKLSFFMHLFRSAHRTK